MMRFIALIFVLLLTVSGVSSQDNTPYIYYYDTLQNGLVIERADGTDSRIIFDVPNVEPVWSPSGKWMVMGSSILSADGETRIQTFLQGYEAYYTIKQWSPDEDVLLLVGANSMLNSLRTQIFDVEHNEILADFETQTFGLDLSPYLRAYWASDGQRAWVYDGDQLITLHHNGRGKLLSNVYGRPFDFYQGKFIHFYLVDDYNAAIIIQDVESERWIELEAFHSRPYPFYRVRWNTTKDHALIYARPCQDDACDSWLKLVDWQSGNIMTMTPTIRIESGLPGCTDYKCSEIWSPQGNYAVLTDTDEKVYLLDAYTGTMQQLGENIRYEWTPDEKLITIDNDLLTGGEGNVSLYDPSSDSEFVLNLPDNVNLYGFDPSPDGQLIALGRNPATIIDLQGNVVVEAIPHSRTARATSYPSRGYVWHPGQQWIIANYDIWFTGGGTGTNSALLFNLDGTVRRELPNRTTAGFVPDNVIQYLAPGQVTTVLREPVFVLPQEGMVTGVGWHPTDPSQLVTYSDDAGLIFWTLADSKPRITDQRMIPYPPQFPLSIKLFWLSERDIAYSERGILKYIDSSTGDSLPIEGVKYPIFEKIGANPRIRYAVSGDIMPIDTDITFDFAALLSSQRDALILSDRTEVKPYFLNSNTGDLIALDREGLVFAADTYRDIIAVGGGYDAFITLYSAIDGSIIDQFHGTGESVAFSSDGRWLATTSNGMTAIWDMSEYRGD